MRSSHSVTKPPRSAPDGDAALPASRGGSCTIVERSSCNSVGFVVGIGAGFSGVVVVVVVVRHFNELCGGHSRGRACDIDTGSRRRGCSRLILLLDKAAVRGSERVYELHCLERFEGCSVCHAVFVGSLVHASVSCELRVGDMLSEAICTCSKSDQGTRVAAFSFMVLVGELNRIRLS